MGGMGGKNMNMMKQIQKMQQDMTAMQTELETRTYKSSAGGGMVTAEVTGKRELLRLVIDPEALNPEDVEMLQDAVVAAVNAAIAAAEADAGTQMSKLTGGLNLGNLGL
jgi:DNA-binding YbaB/EbfC family protein